MRTWIYQKYGLRPAMPSVMRGLMHLRLAGQAEVKRAEQEGRGPQDYNVYELVDPGAKQDELEACPVQPGQHYLKGDRRGRVAYTQTSRSGIVAGLRIGRALRELTTQRLLQQWKKEDAMEKSNQD